jgi:hypothetical protein
MYLLRETLLWGRYRREMPVPFFVHFSKAVYDKLGDEGVEALVAYLNEVYDLRADLDALRRDVKRVADHLHTLTLDVIERLPPPPARGL